MSTWSRLIPLAVAMIGLAVGTFACGGDDSNGPTAVPTVEPAHPGAPPTVAGGTETGIAAVDDVIQAVLTADAAGLEALLRFTEAPCTRAAEAGGPPKCFHYRPAPPDDTVVEAFPLSTCQGEWHTDLRPVVEMLLDREAELYGVVELGLEEPILGLDYYPLPEFGVLLQQEINGENAGVLLGVEDGGGVTYIDFFCFPPPDWIFSEQANAAYGDRINLILEGPAYYPPDQSSNLYGGTRTGVAALDAVLAAIESRDTTTLEGLFRFESVACVEQTTYGGPPQCNKAPGSPPVGTQVDAFWCRSAGSCEFSWAFDVGQLADLLTGSDFDLYVVIEHSRDHHKAVFETIIGETTRGLAVRIKAGKIVELDYLCYEPPASTLARPGPGGRVILYGPAYP
jgi:hypothetical protein